MSNFAYPLPIFSQLPFSNLLPLPLAHCPLSDPALSTIARLVPFFAYLFWRSSIVVTVLMKRQYPAFAIAISGDDRLADCSHAPPLTFLSPVSAAALCPDPPMAGKSVVASVARLPHVSKSSKSKPPKPKPQAKPIVSDDRSVRAGTSFAYPEHRRVRVPPEQALSSANPTRRATANRHYVFVYGTLKRGFANSHLLDRATLIGAFRTLVRYPLVVAGKYNSPCLLDLPDMGNRVKGEVFAVDDATLADLDHLERVGTNYNRKVQKVSCCADRSFVADVFVYFKSNGLEQLANHTFLEDYQCRRYVPRHMRNDSSYVPNPIVQSLKSRR